jgi:hypothetical protein
MVSPASVGAASGGARPGADRDVRHSTEPRALSLESICRHNNGPGGAEFLFLPLRLRPSWHYSLRRENKFFPSAADLSYSENIQSRGCHRSGTLLFAVVDPDDLSRRLAICISAWGPDQRHGRRRSRRPVARLRLAYPPGGNLYFCHGDGLLSKPRCGLPSGRVCRQNRHPGVAPHSPQSRP